MAANPGFGEVGEREGCDVPATILTDRFGRQHFRKPGAGDMMNLFPFAGFAG
jgi:hypothetical protein